MSVQPISDHAAVIEDLCRFCEQAVETHRVRWWSVPRVYMSGNWRECFAEEMTTQLAELKRLADLALPAAQRSGLAAEEVERRIQSLQPIVQRFLSHLPIEYSLALTDGPWSTDGKPLHSWGDAANGRPLYTWGDVPGFQEGLAPEEHERMRSKKKTKAAIKDRQILASLAIDRKKRVASMRARPSDDSLCNRMNAKLVESLEAVRRMKLLAEPLLTQAQTRCDGEPQLLPTIWSHGERSYSIDGHNQFAVSDEHDNILNAFCEARRAMEASELERLSGCTNVARAIGSLKTFHSGVFSPAIRAAEKKGRGGHFIRVLPISGREN